MPMRSSKAVLDDMKNPKRRRGRKKLPDIDISSVRDPEERRRLTKLARNRAAAALCRHRQRRRVTHLTSKVDLLQKHVRHLRELLCTYAPNQVHAALCDDATESFMMSVELNEDYDDADVNESTGVAEERGGRRVKNPETPHNPHTTTDKAWHHVAATKQTSKPANGSLICHTDNQPESMPSTDSHESLITSAVADHAGNDLHTQASYQQILEGQMHDDFLLDSLHAFVAGGASVFTDSYMGSALYGLSTPTSKRPKSCGGLYNVDGCATSNGFVDADAVLGQPVWDCVQGVPVPVEEG